MTSEWNVVLLLRGVQLPWVRDRAVILVADVDGLGLRLLLEDGYDGFDDLVGIKGRVFEFKNAVLKFSQVK